MRALCLAFLLMIAPAFAGDVSDADRQAMQHIISDQIDAFRADDGAKAYGFASPTLQMIFPSSDIFMQMVRKAYQPVYRPQRFKFGSSGPDSAGRPAQHVLILGPDGKNYDALYSFERQADGTWKISGCTILEIPGADA